MQTMPQLSKFYLKALDDPRIGPVHACLYGALFSLWEAQGYSGPLCIFSKDVMPLSKISGATYHKAIRDLHAYGYIKYIPSYNHFLGSLVYIEREKSQLILFSMAIEIITKEDLEAFRSRLLNDLKTLLIERENKVEKQWLRSSEVRKLLKISSGTLQSLRINGILHPSKIGGIIYYKEDEIQTLLNANVTS